MNRYRAGLMVIGALGLARLVCFTEGELVGGERVYAYGPAVTFTPTIVPAYGYSVELPVVLGGVVVNPVTETPTPTIVNPETETPTPTIENPWTDTPTIANPETRTPTFVP